MTTSRSVFAGLLSLTLSVATIACSDATGTTSGGEPTLDASTPPLPSAPPSCAKDGGATWSDLYRDCFGPNEAHCGQSQCHGSSTSAGGGVWVCGDTQDSCYAGITAMNGIIEPNVDPTKTTLYGALRKSGSSCASCMPRNSDFTFEPEDLARIAQWITDGKRNN